MQPREIIVGAIIMFILRWDAAKKLHAALSKISTDREPTTFEAVGLARFAVRTEVLDACCLLLIVAASASVNW
ncbi:MAG: hypothetical protein WDN04_15925 [Rhodospirillales bacterium]